MNLSLLAALLGFSGAIGGAFALMLIVASRKGTKSQGGLDIGTWTNGDASSSDSPSHSHHDGGIAITDRDRRTQCLC